MNSTLLKLHIMRLTEILSSSSLLQAQRVWTTPQTFQNLFSQSFWISPYGMQPNQTIRSCRHRHRNDAASDAHKCGPKKNAVFWIGFLHNAEGYLWCAAPEQARCSNCDIFVIHLLQITPYMSYMQYVQRNTNSPTTHWNFRSLFIEQTSLTSYGEVGDNWTDS